MTWLAPRVGSFPREHRHGLSARTLEKAMELHDELIAARHYYGGLRTGALVRADIALDQLRQYLTLSWKLRWLSNGQYRHVSEMTDEIGRLLGGWKRRQEPRKRQ